MNDLPPPPADMAPVAPALPKVETPKPAAPKVAAPKTETPKPAAPVAAPKAAVPALPPVNDLPPPLPTGSVNIPSVASIRSNTPPEPDISGLDFGKLPGVQQPAAAKPAAPPVAKKAEPAPAKKADTALPALVPVAPAIPSLPLPPKADTGPLLIPVPKPPAALPPSVTERLGSMGAVEPKAQGVVSDKTTVRNIAAEKQAKLDAEAKIKADQEAAAALLKKQQEESDARLKKAQQEIDAKAKADADAKLKAETELAAAKKATEEKAKADAAAAKKAANVLPPPTLPPALPSIPTMPDPLAKSAEPVKLEKSAIGALPAIKPAVPDAPKDAPILPKAPSTVPSNPDLPKLPTLTIPGTKPDQPLPSLTAITGGDTPTTQDILQPRDAVDSAPLLDSAPSLPPVLGAPGDGDDVVTVKRELPEINVGSAPSKPAAPVVKKESKPAAPALPAALPPGLPSIPAAPTITPKTETPVVVASAPSVSTSGNLETSVSFAAGSSALTDNEKATLSGIAEKARKGNKKVRIVGYSSGDADKAAVARKTAFARANIIRAFLLSKGLADSMIHAQALGNQVPQDKADIFLQ